MLWSLALTASTAFPIVILSIWWKRLNAFGAIAGLATGFAVTVLAIVAGESDWIGLEGPLAAALGMPAAAATAIFVTFMTPAPSRHALELVRDIRVPGGEILYDREMRFQRRQKNQRGDEHRMRFALSGSKRLRGPQKKADTPTHVRS